jgi:hypothetical protein
VVSAFTNNVLEELVYGYYPDGYKQNRYCLQLIRVLYRLQQAPRLWYKNIEKVLLSFSFKKSIEESYIFFNDWLIIFFYMDYIAIAFHPKDSDQVHKFKANLMLWYKIIDEGELRWFLGI